METLRQTAIRTRISDIISGKFVRKEGLDPSYVLTNLGEKMSRTKIVGMIVDKFMSEDGSYSSLTVDDDSDSIRIKYFGEDAEKVNETEVGNFVMIIGKVREYANENYIIPEIIKKINKPNYELLHKLEVLKKILEQKKIIETLKKESENFTDVEELKKFAEKKYGISGQVVEAFTESLKNKEEPKKKDYKPMVLETLDKLDEGEGIEIRKLIEECKLPENIFEEVINELLTDGICFEPKPAVLKKV